MEAQDGIRSVIDFAYFPLPGTAPAVVAAAAPGNGVGWWAGSSHAALDTDGTYVIAYRVRMGAKGRGSNVVARSEDGETLTTVCTIEQERFDAQSLEKPSLAPHRRRALAHVRVSRRARAEQALVDRRARGGTTRPTSRPPRPAPSSQATRSPASRIPSSGGRRTAAGRHGSAAIRSMSPMRRTVYNGVCNLTV